MTDNLQHIISDPRWAEIPNDRKQRILKNYVVDTYGDQFTSLDEDRQQNILNNFLSEHGVEIDPEFSIMRIGSQAVRQAIQGAADIVRGVRGLEEKLPEKAPQELSEGGYLAQMRKRADETTAGDPYRAKRDEIVKGIKPIEEYAPEPLEGSSGIIEEAVGGMARFAPSMATSAVSGPAGVASTFVQLYGMKRKEYADQGIESDRADTAAMVSAIAQTPVEFLGNLLQIGALKNIAKSVGKPVAKKAVAFGEALIKGVLGEGGEEFIQQYPDEIANIYAANPDLTGKEIAQEVWNKKGQITKQAGQAAKVGAVGGGLLAGAGGIVGAGFDVLDYRSKKQKQIDEQKEQKKEGTDLYKEKIVDALKAGTITVDELQERKSSENFTPEQVAIFDEAIADYQAGKPNVPDIQEGPIQEIKTETKEDKIQSFVNRIIAGKKMETPEDLQFYENNKDEIERRLQESMSEKDEGLFPQQTKEEQDAIEAEILRQRKAKPPLTGEVPGQKVDRQKQQDEINRIKARRALQTLAPIWDSLGDQEKQVAAELILPKGQEVEVEVERKAKEEIRTAQPDERIEAQRQLKEAERLGLKLDADERKRLEAIAAEPKQMKPEGKRAEVDYSELTKTGEWVEPSEPEQPPSKVAETVPSEKTVQVIGLKTSEKGQRPKPYPFDQTVDEYIESEYQRYLNSKPLGKETDFNAWKASDRGKTAAMDHEMAVRDAVKRGVTVRERVLKGYPGLSESKKLKSESQTDLSVTGELQKEPWEMTQKEFKRKVSSADHKIFSDIEIIDWGSRRGQGKRVGKIVKGAMSDAPQGKKTYIRIFAKLPDYNKHKIELEGMPLHETIPYLKARAAGFDHDTAMLNSYTDIDGHRQIVKNALDEGKPVPDAVIKEYPDLAPKPVEPTKTTEKGIVDPKLVTKKESLEKKIAILQRKIEQSDKTDMPGTYITGGSGVSRSRTRKIDKQLETRINRAVELKKLQKDLRYVKSLIKYSEEAPKREKIKEGAKVLLKKQFDTIEVGDQIDIGGNDLQTVIKKNKKTVVTKGGSKWKANEIAKVVKIEFMKPPSPPEKVGAKISQKIVISQKEFAERYNDFNWSFRRMAQEYKDYLEYGDLPPTKKQLEISNMAYDYVKRNLGIAKYIPNKHLIIDGETYSEKEGSKILKDALKTPEIIEKTPFDVGKHRKKDKRTVPEAVKEYTDKIAAITKRLNIPDIEASGLKIKIDKNEISPDELKALTAKKPGQTKFEMGALSEDEFFKLFGRTPGWNKLLIKRHQEYVKALKSAEKAETKQEKGGAPTPKKVDKKAAKLLDTLKDETGSSELANDILRKAGDLIIDGVETFDRFRREMQKAFKEVWDKIRKHMRALWDVVNNQRGSIPLKGIGEKKVPKKTADDILKDIFAEPKVKQRIKEKEKFDKEFQKDTEDIIKNVSNLKHIWKFIKPGKLTRQGKQDLSYMWDLMLSVPEFFKQKIGAVNRIYQAQQDRMDEYHEHIYQMENHDTVNVVESFKRLKKDRSKARQAQKYLVDADRTGIGFHTKLEDKFWTVYNPKNEIVGEYESNITPDNVDRGETEAIAEMVKAEAEYLAEQGFTPEQIEAVTAFRLTTNKGFELLFRSMRNLMKKYKEAGLKEPELKTFEDGKPKTISLKEAMAIMGDMRGTYFPRIRQSGKYILTAIKGDDRILRTFKTPNMREYIKSKYEAQGYTVETKPSGQLGEDVFDLSGDLVKTQQIIMAAMEKAEKVLSGPWVEGKTELTEEIDKVTEEIQAVFLNAVSEQVANIIRGRGSRVHMTRRNPEVWKGYEEDPEIAIAKYIRGLSGGEAKRNASIKMLQAMTGTDISFKEFQKAAISGEDIGYDFEGTEGKVDRTDYMKFVRERMIDARQQKNAFKWAKAYISEMTRNREMADEVIGFVKGLAVGKYLAFRVFSAPLVNITALPTSVVATLKGAGIPYRQAWRYTARALKTYRQYLQHKKGKFIPKEDQVIFKTIIEKGWDNPQFSSESMQTLRSQLGKTWDKVIDVGMWTFDQSERLNRVATIYAAYKGLKNIHKDKSASQLLDMAKELSDKSHGVYNKGNHPYIALGNNPAAKLAQMFYVFRTFSHTYLLNMKRLGLDKQWGAVAHMAVMPAVLAGAGASVMTPIISGLLKSFGLADEPEEEMYAKIAESFGPEAEAWARHGLVGLGGRGASIKGSLAIGIGDLPTKIEDLFGAPGSIGKDIYYGAKSIRRGDVSKGLEKWSPTGLGNILRSYREYNEGLTTWNNAPKFYGAEPLKASKSEAFMRAVSLSPARLAGISEKQWKERKVEEKYRQWRTDIYAKIKRYIIEGGDDEQWAKIIAEIIKFNEQAERWYLSPITSKSIRMNIKRMYRISKREKLRR